MLSRLSSLIRRPEYLLRPRQLFKRISYQINGLAADANNLQLVSLPWGTELRVYPEEEIGRTLLLTGINDLPLTETLWRLTKPDDFVVDVGANIGYTASIFSRRLSDKGRLVCFEPHPKVHQLLTENISLMKQAGSGCQVQLRTEGLSDKSGAGELYSPTDFQRNMGASSLCNYPSPTEPEKNSAQIELTTLDEAFAEDRNLPIGVLKVDVEGHEPSVLKGGACLLGSHQVRDIVFEDLSIYWKTLREVYESYRFLEEYGYKLFQLSRGLFGPTLVEINQYTADERTGWQGFEAPNYLATVSTDRALELLKPKGWLSLR